MKRHVVTAAIALFVAFLASGTAAAEKIDASNDMSWLDGFSLVVLESDDVAGLHRARSVIQSHGGRVAIMSPPSFLFGWIPFEIRAELIGKGGIEEIYYTEVLPGEVDADDIQSRLMLAYYNSVVRGDIQRKYFEDASRAVDATGWPQGTGDALPQPPLDETAYIKNLESAGLDIEELKARGQLLQKTPQGAAGNSDRMTGTISVTLFFVESDGSGSDPDAHTWTDQHVEDYVNGVNTGLAWWTAQAYNFFDCWNAFLVRFFPPTDPRCQQPWEPVLHSSSFSSTWVSLVMDNFGYTFGSHFSQVNAYNTFQRTTYGTDWAYSAFIGYNPPGSPDRFTNGTSAFAWLGGPYTVLLYRSFTWNPDRVFTHETGHIFYACDEYNGSNCSCTGCVGKPNENCYVCGVKDCMMKLNSFVLCAWTPAQIGWETTGCAPAPLPPPVLTGVDPSGALQGVRTTITLTGSDFLFDAGVDFGPDVTVHSTTFVNSQTFTAEITVNNSAPLGFVDVTAFNRDLQSSTLPGAFELRPTRRHYASLAGGNVFPYATVADAALTLADAVNAAGDGDSVLVESAVFADVSLYIPTGVAIYGAWNSTFDSRDLVSGKTVVDLNGNIWIQSATAPVVLDGLILENGEGIARNLPIQGDYGGAVMIDSSAVTVSNCEIRSNALSTAGLYGAGGGIYASASSIDFHDNVISNNSASQGGAVFLDNCSGSLTGNTISGNQLLTSTVPSALGGGVYVANSSSIAFTDNTISGNSADTGLGGLSSGGGLYVGSSTGITVSGGRIAYNEARIFGGGVHCDASDLSLDSVVLERNLSLAIGGGISTSGASTVAMTDCRLLWNSALNAGGAYLMADEAYVDHNLFVGNSASSSGGGCQLVSAGVGSFIGNTLDRNSAASTGGVIFSSTAVQVFNNIITNSGDAGVSCSGTTSPALSHNNVWNSGGPDYVGCTPGVGSISGDPFFADTSGADYHLALHSPCIDAGNPDPAYNDPDGSRGDMGIYGSHAFIMDQPSYPKNLAAALSGGDVVLSWSANPEADVASYAVYKDCTQDFAPSLSNFLQLVAAPDSTFNAGALADTCYYKISAVDTSGYASGYSTAARVDAPTGIDGQIARRFYLYQNHPNPFNPVTRIRYEIAEPSRVRLSVFDVQGRLVKRVVDTVQGPGLYSVVWDGTNQDNENIASGIYFYRLDAGGRAQTRKMVMLK